MTHAVARLLRDLMLFLSKLQGTFRCKKDQYLLISLAEISAKLPLFTELFVALKIKSSKY